MLTDLSPNRPELSAEARVLLGPSAAFRELAQEPGGGGAWMLVRRPLLLAFMFGSLVSLQASGRVSVRLIADGALSFAFVPLFEMISVAAVYRLAPRRISLTRAVDLFFAANAPWLLWMIAFAALRCLETPRQATAPPIFLLWILELSLVMVAAWSAWIDIQFFREVLPRPAPSPGRDLILQRAIAWTCTIGYFFGYAIWPFVVSSGT